MQAWVSQSGGGRPLGQRLVEGHAPEYDVIQAITQPARTRKYIFLIPEMEQHRRENMSAELCRQTLQDEAFRNRILQVKKGPYMWTTLATTLPG
jgi:hypothetical protein